MRRAFPLAALALAWGAVAAADTPPCLSSARVEPERAFVGQQVRYRLLIESRENVAAVEWVEPPTFAGFRAEWIPGRPHAGDVTHDGVPYDTREELRALFPQRAGELVVAPPGLRCRVRGGEEQVARVPPVALRVRALPEEGRPQEFAGLVGPITVRTSATPRRLSLGESARVSVVLRGAGNLWEATTPLAEDAFPDAEVFPLRPEQSLQPGETLFARRTFAWDVVPRREGELAVPEIFVPYFDPEKERYAFARAAPVVLAVGPRAHPSASATPRPDRSVASDEEEVERDGGGGLAILSTALVIALGAAVTLWRRRRPSGRVLADPHLGEARAAVATGDREAEVAALSRALRTALAAHVPEAAQLPPDQIEARSTSGAISAAARQLAAVERARFDPEAPAPDASAVARAIEAL